MPTLTIRNDISMIIEHVEKEGGINSKVERILVRETRRRLLEYRLIDTRFMRKYGMTLEEFERNEIVKKMGYSFEVESDYHDWDAAVDQIETLEKDLRSLCKEKSITLRG